MELAVAHNFLVAASGQLVHIGHFLVLPCERQVLMVFRPLHSPKALRPQGNRLVQVELTSIVFVNENIGSTRNSQHLMVVGQAHRTDFTSHINHLADAELSFIKLIDIDFSVGISKNNLLMIISDGSSVSKVRSIVHSNFLVLFVFMSS